VFAWGRNGVNTLNARFTLLEILAFADKKPARWITSSRREHNNGKGLGPEG
jgi:hypothetical protein